MTATDAPAQAASLEPEVHETHTGIVVLVGDKAYKAKKPVATDVLDFSSARRREAACMRELELNSRLAPDSYLGLAHLSHPTGGPAEPVVVMRRYANSCRLAAIVAQGLPVDRELAAIAALLSRFHDEADAGARIDAEARPGALAARWQENIGELRRFAPTVASLELIDRIEQLARNYLLGREVLFAKRIRDRRIVDGHGDLLADDIFLAPEGPALLDCLEFDDQLRYVDRIDDAAFLAMDLEFLGRKDLADSFLAYYARLSSDDAPSSLKDFYIAYRAVVRAKVACVRYEQGKADAAQDATRHLDLATRHLTAGAVRLVLIGGGPGTGKTTLAHALAERVGANVISTDDVRRQLLQSGAINGEAGTLDQGLYSPDNISAVYAEVICRARALLTGGRSVILDATWHDAGRRAVARALASETRAALIAIVCSAPIAEAGRRVAVRTTGTSDATPAVVEALAGSTDAWTDAHRIDSSRGLRTSATEAEKLWQALV